MGRIFKGLKFVLVLIVCTLLMSSVGVHKTYASNVPSDVGDKGQASIMYTLTYPNGSTETTYDKSVAEKKTKEWKLLYEGTTDEDGQLILKEWSTKGDIRIVEIEAPEGYEIITKEKEVSLEDGEVTFVNKKKEEPKPEPKKEEPKPETPRPVTIPKTGIDSLTPYKSHHPHPDTPQEPEEEETIEDEKANFIINKVDQEKKPLKGAKFEVYGKPVMEEDYVIKITKNYEYPDNGPEVDVNLPKTDIDISGPKVDIDAPDVDIEGPKVDIDLPDVPDNSEENQEAPETQEEPCFLMAAQPNRGGSDDSTGDDANQNVKLTFIDTTITINVSYNGEDSTYTITPEEKTVTIKVKPGTYIISEKATLEGQEANPEDRREQSYLQSYKIIIDKNGKITKEGGSSWLWLRSKYISGKDIFVLDICSQNKADKVGVKLAGDTITITNFVFFNEGEKCPPK